MYPCPRTREPAKSTDMWTPYTSIQLVLGFSYIITRSTHSIESIPRSPPCLPLTAAAPCSRPPSPPLASPRQRSSAPPSRRRQPAPPSGGTASPPSNGSRSGARRDPDPRRRRKPARSSKPPPPARSPASAPPSCRRQPALARARARPPGPLDEASRECRLPTARAPATRIRRPPA